MFSGLTKLEANDTENLQSLQDHDAIKSTKE